MHKPKLSGVGILVGVWIVSSSLGCEQQPDHPPTSPVTVTVLQEGKPLPKATVCLINTAPNAASGSGISGEDGKVPITTFEHGDGLVPGNYKVTVRKIDSNVTPNPNDPDAPPLKEEVIWLVPKKYSSVSSTPLTAEITPDGKNEFTFDVKK